MLYNWRAALNNLVYMAAIIDSGLDPPEGGRGLEFPICPVSEKFRRNRHKLKGLTDEHQGWIETVQPYQAPEAYQRHPLWCLHELSRVDRHRAVHVVNGFVNSHVSIEVEPRTPNMSVQSVWVVPAGKLEDGAVLGGFMVTPPNGEVGVRAQYSGQVDIDEALVLDDRLLGIRNRLGAIHDTVRGLITQFHNGVT